MKENTNFEPHECVNSVLSTKIGTHENKAIHSSNSPSAGVHYICKIGIKYAFLLFCFYFKLELVRISLKFLLCRLRSIAAQRDHFVRRLSAGLSGVI